MKNKKKGFTLVELIVVLAILAILAAMLVPALTGYIDKANEKKIVAIARQYAIAAQSTASDAYASNKVVDKIQIAYSEADKTTVTVKFSSTGDSDESCKTANVATTNNWASSFYNLAEIKEKDTATLSFTNGTIDNNSEVKSNGYTAKFDGENWSAKKD